jgi:hypothetical protein
MAFERRAPGIRHELGNYARLKHVGILSFPVDRRSGLAGTQLSKAGSMDADMHIIQPHALSPIQMQSVVEGVLERIPPNHDIMVTAPGETHWRTAGDELSILPQGSRKAVPVRIKRVNIMREALPDHQGDVHPRMKQNIDRELGTKIGLIRVLSPVRQPGDDVGGVRKAELFKIIREHSATMPGK